MVSFPTLQFSDDLKTLNVEVSMDEDARSDYFLYAIYVEYYKNRNVSGAPSTKAYKLFDNSENPDKTKYEYSGTMPDSVLNMATNGVDTFKDGLFYVIAICQNKTDETNLVADAKAVLDWTAVYNRGMTIVNSALAGCKSGSCSVNEDLEQFVLVYHSLDLSIDANDADQLDRLWSRFISFSPINGNSSSTNCNCI